MPPEDPRVKWFIEARYGLFVHFGLYSLLGRGEWVMNRERIPPAEYRKLADEFHPERFDADEICRLAVEGGMQYVVFTTMHHDGFRLYDTGLSDFCSTRTAAGRDFVAEMIAACRRHNLRIGLYHSLNNWYDQPDGAAALERRSDYDTFIEHTFARIRELVERYAPFDIFWYDGRWPFDAEGWQAERMNAMVRSILPDVIVNGRNGLPGDYATPEQHMTPPSPWRPWEACITLNEHWGYHSADHNWKSPSDVVKMLGTAANGVGNLLLNIGPRGDGSIPEPSVEILRTVGEWLRNGGGAEAISGDTLFQRDLRLREGFPNDHDPNGLFTAKGGRLFVILRFVPGEVFSFSGLETTVRRVSCSGEDLRFTQHDDRVRIDLPSRLAKTFCPVLALDCDEPPRIYRTGGMRVPNAPHPRYDA